MRLHADGSNAWTAPSVRNAEGLMQIQVADIRTEVGWPAEAHKRVHIRAIHVDLSPVIVNDIADLHNALLEYPMGGRIGHHQGGERCRMPFCFASEVGDIDIPVGITMDGNHFETSHRR